MSQPPRLFFTRACFPEIANYLRSAFEVTENPADRILSRAELAARLDEYDAVFAMPSDQFDAELLQQSKRLRMLGLMAVGFNNVDLAAANARRIMVSNTPDVLTETTADFGFALLLAAARHVTRAEHWLRAGKWQRWAYDGFLGMDVHHSTLGIIGMGRIGQALARRAAGFSMRVVYCNRRRLAPQVEQACGASYLSQAELLAQADHLILTVPYEAQTRHLIGAAELAQMKPGAVLVNLARGGVVDDAALAQALQSGHLGAAGLDVFENEPALHPALLELENVVLTPHIASASNATRRAMAKRAADNLLAMAQGRPLDWVNPWE
ncbi:D-glycerate dehydrogenase [Massilia sp. W12]|uniref:2-hydroxyacid dehydrogenase n=1 Tax=Massilia sp. W12 TaxID=3126507 RepID=UPI0030CC7380